MKKELTKTNGRKKTMAEPAKSGTSFAERYLEKMNRSGKLAQKTKKTTAPAENKKSGASRRQNSDPVSLEERIRVKAYELYLDRGANHGCDVDDWLTAERIILSQN